MIWSGVSSGYTQLEKALRMAIKALSFAYDWAVGASMIAYIIMVISWRILSSGVTIGVVMVWWKNSIVSDIISATVLRIHNVRQR